MSETMKVLPSGGYRVLDPVTLKALPAEGADVPRNAYWLRRLRDGDVILEDHGSREPRRATSDRAGAKQSATTQEA